MPATAPVDSALHDKRVAEALQLQRSRAAAADALKAKNKVPFVALLLIDLRDAFSLHYFILLK